MKMRYGLMAALIASASLAAIVPSAAAGYIPIGPKVYTPTPPTVIKNPDLVTPQPDIITPQPDLITTTDVVVSPATHDSGGSPSFTPTGNEPGFWNEKCQTFAYVNDDCTVQALNIGGGGFPAVVRTDTVITPQPDLVTPQPDTVINNPPSCKRLGIGGSGLGYYSC